MPTQQRNNATTQQRNATQRNATTQPQPSQRAAQVYIVDINPGYEQPDCPILGEKTLGGTYMQYSIHWFIYGFIELEIRISKLEEKFEIFELKRMRNFI